MNRSWTSSTGTSSPAGSAPKHAAVTREHTFRSIAASTARAREVLGYEPRYSSLDALREALAWLAANGQADLDGQALLANRR